MGTPTARAPLARHHTRLTPSQFFRELTWNWRLLPFLLAYLFFMAYAAYALLLQRRMLTFGFDLGIFDQAMRNYAHFRAPDSAIRGMNILGDHFHPVLMLITPLYWIFPDPRTLLVTQAFLLALSVIPMTRMAIRVFGTAAGASIGVAYGLSWGLQSAVGYDFHEVCFAVPLLAFGLEQFLLGRYRRAFAWWVPLVFVKEDLGVTLAAAAVPLWFVGRRKLAAVHLLTGVAAFLLTVLVVLPMINGHGTYAYWGMLSGKAADGPTGPVTPSGSMPLSHEILVLPVALLYPSVKWMTLLTLLLPTGLLALRSPIAAMLVPTLLWRFLSGNTYYWGTGFHYSADLMPIVFAAFCDAVVRLRSSGPRLLRAYAAKAAVIPIVAALCIGRDFPLIGLLHPDTWLVPPRVTAAHKLLDRIPDGVRVAVSGRYAPQLTGRDTVTQLPRILPGTAYAVVSGWDQDKEDTARFISQLQAAGWHLLAEDEGTYLFAPGPAAASRRP